ncbi:MAG: glycoside hydrolase family 3 C-terminal domain-containing protein [Erysipelotrichales bacterium]|nr:glycoside hydrolase family 3 C-terminal domain-containing protein [Erysipelotrichales bacterium]
MFKDFFKGKKGVKRIILMCVSVFLVGVMVAGNIVLDYFSPMLHSFFSGGSGDLSSSEAKNALGTADELVGEIAEESIVLLKNEDNFLPLEASEKVNFFGWGSSNNGFLLVGGGSGGVGNSSLNEDNAITLLEAFNEYETGLYNRTLAQKYETFSNYDADAHSFSWENVIGALQNPEESFYDESTMNNAYDFSTTAVVVLSRYGTENGGSDELVNIGGYRNGQFLELTSQERIIFNKLEEYGFNVVVLLNTGNPIELKFLEEYQCIKACMYVGIPGQSGARAIPEIMYGEKLIIERDDNGKEKSRTYEPISPSGRLSDIYAYSWQEHNPTYINATPTGFGNTNTIAYSEGIYFGYKWYETADVSGYFSSRGVTYEDVVQYPFGYGLSYTEFEQEIIDVSWNNGEKMDGETTYSVTVRVKNVGDKVGRDVVQLYFTPPYIDGGIEKASINLLAFDKTKLLKPEIESSTECYQDITLSFKAYDMASYDDYDKNSNGFKGYELDEGQYDIKLMQNSHEVIDDNYFLDCNGLKFENDPVTGKKVENRFTGENAYANMPIDGSKGARNGGVTYLSREKGFANYSNLKKVSGPTNDAMAAANYDFDGYDKEDISGFEYGLDNELYLTTSNGSKPLFDDLDGSNKNANLKYNYELMEKLQDWDNPLWKDFLNQLTQEEIQRLIGMGGFQTEAIESVGKTRNFETDGPAGFNNSTSGGNSNWVIFPAEALTGCSWSQRLTYNIGLSQGQIGNATGVQGWYAPGVNLHRSVYNERNFEYYSEDAILSGKLASETVRGAKQKGLICYVKHFVISDNGQNAGDWYEWLTEQTLREVYLKAFEFVVKEGGANAMMSAFNKLGAVWCGYNHALLTDILRTEWGFHGSIITDYCNINCYMEDYNRAIKAGNDLYLRATNSSAKISFTNVGAAYGARESVKSLLYTYLDTIVSAKQYQDKVDKGEIDDKYDVSIGPNVTAAPKSALFIVIWVMANVLIVGGIVTCITFMFYSKKRKEIIEQNE